MIHLSDFDLSERERSIFIENGIEDDTDILINLELYKFRTRDTIVHTLNDIFKGKQNYRVLRDYSSDAVFAEVERRFNVLIKQENKEVFVYAQAFSELKISSLELELMDYNVSVFYITPLNFLECSGKSFPKYNAEILFKRIVLEVLRLKATDIHFDVKHVDLKPVYSISYRRDADLLPLTLFDMNQEVNALVINSLIEKRTNSISTDLLSPAGVVTNADNIFGDSDIELRVSANKVKDGYHYVIRIQEKQTFSFSIEKLGFQGSVTEDLLEVLNKRSGITLITGAIRTGKNTTAYALLNRLVKEPLKIISYESPIEVLMPFTQVDYYSNEESLLNAVRLAKKQDINIAFINEIPNKEVAFALQDLANSSIHVITTMHIDRAWHLPYKLKEYFGDNYKDIISQINGIFNQKMFGVQCPYCKEEHLVASLPHKKTREFLQKYELNSVFLNKGCDVCDFMGKVPGKNQPYSEHLLFTDEFKSRLLQCDHPYQMELLIKEELIKTGHTLEDYLITGIRQGRLSSDNLKYVL